ncbi:MAG: hypothetical protein R2939_19055 [Kofleriaceae bacterium]
MTRVLASIVMSTWLLACGGGAKATPAPATPEPPATPAATAPVETPPAEAPPAEPSEDDEGLVNADCYYECMAYVDDDEICAEDCPPT